MDSTDQMDEVYEALVRWADAVIIASPIRWTPGHTARKMTVEPVPPVTISCSNYPTIAG
jgi:hypothetical protein